MSDFTQLMARMFPVDPARIQVAITKLRNIRDGAPGLLTTDDAHTILNALVRYEASVQTAGASVAEAVNG